MFGWRVQLADRPAVGSEHANHPNQRQDDPWHVPHLAALAIKQALAEINPSLGSLKLKPAKML